MLFFKKTIKNPNEPVYGDITNRLFATVIDMLILLAPLSLITELMLRLFFKTPHLYFQLFHKLIPQHPEFMYSFFGMMRFIATYYPADFAIIIRQDIFEAAITFIVIGCYIIPFIWKLGATPGKISLSQSIIRYLAYIISVPFGLFYGGIRRDKRCWHDFIADTVVIYSPTRWYKRHLDSLIGKIKAYFNIKH